VALGGTVVSAAIIEGSLIIGLSDGSIINAGWVQGPEGLKGDPGPIGATGDRGTDGNTIHTVAGTPGNEMGVDGDYAIDNINWRIYGPRSGGTWGKAKEMLPGKEVLENGRTQAYSGATGGGGGGDTNNPVIERPAIIDDGSNTPPTVYPPYGGQPGSNLQHGDMWVDANGALHFYYDAQWNKVSVYSDQVFPADDAPYLIVTPNGEVFTNQQQYNEWLYTKTDRRPIIANQPPTVHPDFPAYPLNAGDFWIDANANNSIYYWDGTTWQPIAGDTNRPPIYSDTEPTEHPDFSAPDNQLVVGDIWYDTSDDFNQYIWDGIKWVDTGAYVKKKGDEMTGPLLLQQVDVDGNKTPQELTELSNPATATHKEYVDEQDESLRQQVIELEEELEGLAPSLVRGTWKYSDTYTKDPGYFGARTSGGGLATDWESIGRLVFNAEDENGVTHGFADVEDGTYFQIFEQGSETAAMFQATGAAFLEDGDQWKIDVAHVQSVADTFVQLEASYRFKIFALNNDNVDATDFLSKTGDTIGTGDGGYSNNPDTTYRVKLKPYTGYPDVRPQIVFQGDPSNDRIYGDYFTINDLGFMVSAGIYPNFNLDGKSSLCFYIQPGYRSTDDHFVRRYGAVNHFEDSDVVNVGYSNRSALRSAAVPVQQVDWTNQTYSAGIWVLQDDPGAGDPDIQRFMLSDAAFADVREADQVRYISVHALGGGDFINYQNEKVGDLIQVYGSPLPKSFKLDGPDDVPDGEDGVLQIPDVATQVQARVDQEKLAFGIYQIDGIQEHNFPENIEGGDFTNAFTTFTVTPLATANAFLTDDLCQIKTMPDPRTSGDGKYLPLTGGQLTGDLNVTGSKIKGLILDSGQNSQLQIQHNGNTRIYVGNDQVTFQQPIKLNKEGTESDHVVTKGYVDTQIANNNQIGEPIKVGEFTLKTQDARPTGAANAGEMVLWHIAPGSTTTPVNEFKARPNAGELDVYEIIAKLQELVGGDNPVDLIFRQGNKELIYKAGTPGWVASSSWHCTADSYDGDTLTEGETVEVFGQVPGAIDLTNLPYLKTTGGELTGDLDVNGVLQVEGDDAFYIRNHSSVLQIKPNELINGAILANAMYDPQNGYLKDYLPLSGGKLTGDLDVTGSKIKTLDLDSGQNSTLNLKHNGNTKVYIGSDSTTFQEQVKLNKEGTEDFHAVTKKYVDDVVLDLPYLNQGPVF